MRAGLSSGRGRPEILTNPAREAKLAMLPGRFCMHLLVAASLLICQQSPPAPNATSPANQYLDRYREVVNLTSIPDRVADVEHLVLERDVGRLALERGKLYLLSPVGGRTVAAVFRGVGRFTFEPPLPSEQAELHRFAGSSVLDDTISEAILIFSDSTAAQLERLSFGAAEVPGDVRDHVRELVGSLKG